ncbi:MAG: bifunctional (p)ppGpp synthetase/guanosine-3',5'-bis(diphosphate) 3'-pyrophosphohydrolase [Anaerolineae bacterium]|nr:bifunctional (p)ppGpp synthetase/guanosine-3',5'-bis(diphosphate) 3'-pyrophosphohydrolase [Anaerolineae bacterium]
MTVGLHPPQELDGIFNKLPKLSSADQDLIVRAYDLAARAHEGQVRKSGEPYMIHPVAVAQILSELKLDAPAIAAALLHDVVEDTDITVDDLEREFGLTVAQLVDGVTKMDRLPTQPEATPKGAGHKPGNKDAETLRKLFLAMSNDMRVVLIKLADRIHNMRTLGYLSPERQKRMARETIEIFAPLANRLGIWQMKWELEDLSFRYLNPDRYKEIAGQLNERRTDRQKYMDRVRDKLMKELHKAGIEATIMARPKHIYSIYRKMDRKQVNFEEVYDVRAVRVIVKDNPTCYHVLGIVHSLWRPIPSEFDDYIASPKENFYRSLHTAVIDDEGKTLEVQIRTSEMHEHAEYGVAAHWRYKEGAKADKEFEERLKYLRKLMDFDERTEQNAEEFVNAMKSDVFENRVYVFTPKGDIVDLPAGATPIDFAYHIHTDVGHRCRGAKINGQMVGLDYRLRSGDRVEILRSKQGGPSLDWLNPNLGYIRTSRAADKIRIYFRKLDREKNVALGTDVIDRELKRLGVGAIPRETIATLLGYNDSEELSWHVGLGDITGAQIASKVVEFEREKHIGQGKEILERELVKLGTTLARETCASLFGYTSAKTDDFLELVGSGEITPTQISVKVSELERRQQAKSNGKGPVSASEGIDLGGNKGGMLINLARCCNPAVGDDIIGYITRGKGVTVHRSDCKNIINTKERERLISVSWTRVAQKTYPVPIIINAYDREGLMRDVGAVVANEHINVSDVNVSTRGGIATFLLTFEIEEVGQLTKVLSKIEQLPNVLEARRRT